MTLEIKLLKGLTNDYSKLLAKNRPGPINCDALVCPLCSALSVFRYPKMALNGFLTRTTPLPFVFNISSLVRCIYVDAEPV